MLFTQSVWEEEISPATLVCNRMICYFQDHAKLNWSGGVINLLGNHWNQRACVDKKDLQGFM